MVDPVCFLLISPSVAQHFCYRPPSNFLDELVDYFVAREIGVNNALHRHFQWKINDLDPQLLPVDSAIILSELDSYVPSLHVERLLKKERPEVAVKVLANYFHSEFQLTREGFSTAAAMSKVSEKIRKKLMLGTKRGRGKEGGTNTTLIRPPARLAACGRHKKILREPSIVGHNNKKKFSILRKRRG